NHAPAENRGLDSRRGAYGCIGRRGLRHPARPSRPLCRSHRAVVSGTGRHPRCHQRHRHPRQTAGRRPGARQADVSGIAGTRSSTGEGASAARRSLGGAGTLWRCGAASAGAVRLYRATEPLNRAAQPLSCGPKRRRWFTIAPLFHRLLVIAMFDEIPRQRPHTPLLDRIENPADLRGLDEAALPQRAEELRAFLLYTVGQTGGHFGAGLGVVELTIALHYLYNTPDDRLVWDVGHQTYPHKILTGRRERMASMRQHEGLAGFPKRGESDYDTFGVGHSSTSISAALGMAIAAQREGEGRRVAAVIGDGAMTAGMRSEERRVGKECRGGGAPEHCKKRKDEYTTRS